MAVSFGDGKSLLTAILRFGPLEGPSALCIQRGGVPEGFIGAVSKTRLGASTTHVGSNPTAPATYSLYATANQVNSYGRKCL